MKYHLQYVESCSTKIVSFKSKAARDQFIKDFYLKNIDNPEDNWVDLLFEGKIEWRRDFYATNN